MSLLLLLAASLAGQIEPQSSTLEIRIVNFSKRDFANCRAVLHGGSGGEIDFGDIAKWDAIRIVSPIAERPESVEMRWTVRAGEGGAADEERRSKLALKPVEGAFQETLLLFVSERQPGELAPFDHRALTELAGLVPRRREVQCVNESSFDIEKVEVSFGEKGDLLRTPLLGKGCTIGLDIRWLPLELEGSPLPSFKEVKVRWWHDRDSARPTGEASVAIESIYARCCGSRGQIRLTFRDGGVDIAPIHETWWADTRTPTVVFATSSTDPEIGEIEVLWPEARRLVDCGPGGVHILGDPLPQDGPVIVRWRVERESRLWDGEYRTTMDEIYAGCDDQRTNLHIRFDDFVAPKVTPFGKVGDEDFNP